MNEDKEALWILIHAKICYALTMGLNVQLQRDELELLQEQMPNLLMKVIKE